MTPPLDPQRLERAAKAMADRRAELIHAPLARIHGDLARAAITAYLGETHVVVPASALAWLNGEAPDADGKWFGDCEDAAAESPIAGRWKRAYWWRSKFRAMIAAELSTREKT